MDCVNWDDRSCRWGCLDHWWPLTGAVVFDQVKHWWLSIHSARSGLDPVSVTSSSWNVSGWGPKISGQLSLSIFCLSVTIEDGYDGSRVAWRYWKRGDPITVSHGCPECRYTFFSSQRPMLLFVLLTCFLIIIKANINHNKICNNYSNTWLVDRKEINWQLFC